LLVVLSLKIQILCHFQTSLENLTNTLLTLRTSPFLASFWPHTPDLCNIAFMAHPLLTTVGFMGIFAFVVAVAVLAILIYNKIILNKKSKE